MQNEIAQTARFCYTGDREKKGGAEMNLDIHLYHLLVMTDLRGKIYSVEWKDEASRVRSSNAFLALTAGGNLFAALDIDPAQEGGVLRLEDKVFHYERFRVQEMYYYLIKSFFISIANKPVFTMRLALTSSFIDVLFYRAIQ